VSGRLPHTPALVTSHGGAEQAGQEAGQEAAGGGRAVAGESGLFGPGDVSLGHGCELCYHPSIATARLPAHKHTILTIKINTSTTFS
jgi:hypothetical protein